MNCQNILKNTHHIKVVKYIILEKNKEYIRTYKNNLSPEKIKEYNKKAYENRKKNY